MNKRLSNPKHCFIALFLLGFSQSLHAEYPEFIAYAEDGIFTELEHGLILTSEQRSRLDEFKLQRSKQSRYFAAYAQSPGGQWGRTGSYNTLSAAKTEAISRCEWQISYGKEQGYITHNPGTCRVLAVILPTGYSETDTVTLGYSASKGYRRFLEKGSPKAFAVGNQHNWASNHNAKSIEWARQRAMKTCLGEGVYPQSQLPTGETCVIIAEQK